MLASVPHWLRPKAVGELWPIPLSGDSRRLPTPSSVRPNRTNGYISENLRRRTDRLTDNAAARLQAALTADDPHGEVTAAWICAQDLARRGHGFRNWHNYRLSHLLNCGENH
jgi:hypothetical protein